MWNAMKKQWLDEAKSQIQILEHFNHISTLTELNLEQLFNEHFMQQFTDAPTIRQFFKAGNFQVNSISDLEKIPSNKLNQYVQEKTNQFETWEELLIAARLFWLENYV